MSSFGHPHIIPGATGLRQVSAGRRAEGSLVWNDVSADIPMHSADPETLARALRAHKTGDVFAQAVLTIALMLAIGIVAVVLSVERASAAGFLVRGVIDTSAALAAVAVVGAGLLFATRAALRAIKVRNQKH